ncbi:MAG: YgjP-like metallopeptidase domain-containing protein [Pseudomonadota bacterium]
MAVRTHARARRLILRVTEAGEVRLTIPRGTRQRDIDQFLHEQRQWVMDSLQGVQKLAGPEVTVPPQSLRLAAVDENWTLEFRTLTVARRTRVSLRPSTSAKDFVLRIDLAPDASASQSDLAGLVRRELMRRAQRLYESCIDQLKPQMGVAPKRIQVRNQRSVWGSCSSQGTVSLNYAGLFLEPRIARYLCVHELAHLKHMNHSDAFWGFVVEFEPDALHLDTALGRTHDVVPRWLWQS